MNDSDTVCDSSQLAHLRCLHLLKQQKSLIIPYCYLVEYCDPTNWMDYVGSKSVYFLTVSIILFLSLVLRWFEAMSVGWQHTLQCHCYCSVECIMHLCGWYFVKWSDQTICRIHTCIYLFQWTLWPIEKANRHKYTCSNLEVVKETT